MDSSEKARWDQQLTEIIECEVRLHYRRRVLVLMAVLIAAFTAILTLIPDNPLLVPPSDENTPDWAPFLSPGMMLASVLHMTVVVAVPLLLADTLPSDRRTRLRELSKTYIASNLLYLTGKITGALLTVLLLIIAMIITQFSLTWVFIGSFQASFYLDLVIWNVIPTAIYVTCLSILFAVGQRSRIGATTAALAVIGLCLLSAMPGTTMSFATPANGLAFAYLTSKWGNPIGFYSRSNPVSADEIYLALLLGLIQVIVTLVIAQEWLRRKETTWL